MNFTCVDEFLGGPLLNNEVSRMMHVSAMCTIAMSKFDEKEMDD